MTETLKSLSKTDKKQLIRLIIWLISGTAMVIMGVLSIINSTKAVSAVSAMLGIFSLLTGLITLGIRINQRRTAGGGALRLDGVIWLVLAFFLFNTALLSKLGKIVFIVIGISVCLSGVTTLLNAKREHDRKSAFIPRIIIAVMLFAFGGWVIGNAEAIFNNLLGAAIGVYLIVHGAAILYDWKGRLLYFKNFRSLENG